MSIIFLINPIGAFPLNDDWAYSRNVYFLSEQGILNFSDWPAMTLIAHVLWGTAWTKIFGFSFSVLRISTLVLGLGGILVFYRYLIYHVNDQRLAFIGTLTLALNPIYICLCFSFMTDIPFLLFFMISAFGFLIFLKNERSLFWWIAVFSSITAVLIRQFGLLLPLVFLIIFLIKKEKNGRNLLRATLPLLATWLVLKGYSLYLESVDMLSSHYGTLGDLIERLATKEFWASLSYRVGNILFYWGIFTLPYTLLHWSTIKLSRFYYFIILIVVAILAYCSWDTIPIGNILSIQGIGPMVFKDTVFGENINLWLPDSVWVAIKIIGFIASTLLIASCISKVKYWWIVGRKENDTTIAGPLFLILLLGGYSIFLLLNYTYFDRYLLPTIPIIIILIADFSSTGNYKRWAIVGSLFFMSLFGFLGISGTHDYLAWNSARWEMLDTLMDTKEATPYQIDGGFEFNGWHNTGIRTSYRPESKSWWFLADDEYVISKGPIDCYEVLDKRIYTNWLERRKDTIWLMQRHKFIKQSTISCEAEELSPDGHKLVVNENNLLISGGRRQDSLKAYSGQYSIKLSEPKPYGFSLQLDSIAPCSRLTISVWRWGKSGAIVASGDGFYIVDATNIIEEAENGWKKIELEFTLPADFKGSTVSIYMWNNRSEPSWFDDLKVEIQT